MRLTRVLLGLLLLTQSVQARPDYRFAPDFSADDFSRPTRAREFVEQYIRHEAPFFKAARHPQTSISYDGINLNPQTGQLQSVRHYSAPSKECLDLGLLIKGLEGHPLAALLISPEAPERAPGVAAQMLARKLSGYQAWYAKYPGFRGYMPWFDTDTLEPTNFVAGDIPGLDNGEWIWVMLVAERELRLRGHKELARGYAQYVDRMCKSAVALFWDPQKRLQRANVRIADPKNPESPIVAQDSYLRGEHGVHEGVMILLFVTLLGEGLPPAASRDIWNSTRMVRVETRYGTTWQGWNGSSHESWQYLFLPMRDIPQFRQLFRIREIIRSQNAVARHYPGFATAALDPRGDGGPYLEGAGIEDIGSQKLKNQHIYTLYGAFPSLLLYADDPTKPNLGLTWVLNMLKPNRMQGPLGAGEAGTNDGAHVAPVKTTDGTYPNLLALMGGLERETADMMKERGVYQGFLDILNNEYKEAFGSAPLKEPCVFLSPTQAVPQGVLPDYQEPSSPAP